MIPYILIAFLSAMIAVTWIHPKLVKIASMKNIVDCPDARKLQRTPIPVLGGVAVFFGIVLGRVKIAAEQATQNAFYHTILVLDSTTFFTHHEYMTS